MNVGTYEPTWIITWSFPVYFALAKLTKYILKKHLQRYLSKFTQGTSSIELNIRIFYCTNYNWDIILNPQQVNGQ